MSVLCGTLTATYLRLASLSVRRGGSVDAGDRLGTVGPRGLHLGARRTGRRWSYVDPLGLLGEGPAARPVPPLPAGRWRAGPPPLGPHPARARTHPLAGSAPVPAAATRSIPVIAWLGLALLAASVPTLGLVNARRRRRRREAAEAALARASGYAPSDAA